MLVVVVSAQLPLLVFREIVVVKVIADVQV